MAHSDDTPPGTAPDTTPDTAADSQTHAHQSWDAVFSGKRLPAPENEDEQIADQARQVLLWRQARHDARSPAQQITPKQAQAYYHYVDNLRRHRRPRWYKRPALLLLLVASALSLLFAGWYGSRIQPSGTPTGSTVNNVTTTPAPVPHPAPHDVLPAMVSLPGATFIMGCSPGWDDVLGGCKDSERPPHPVSVTAFQIGRYEITVGQFRRFVEASGYVTTAEQTIDAGCTIKPEGQLQWVLSKPHNWRNPGFAQTDQHPVVCLSWQDTQHYLAWLNQKTGKHYRLPTEEEWEYAARGGKITAFFWGDQANRRFANYQGTGGTDQWQYTAPVGQFSSNAFGLYDVAGNAWEWVESCWRRNYLNTSRIGENTCTSGTNAARARRGGGWDNYPPSIRSAYRNAGHELERSYLYGFRIAHDADITDSP